MFRGCRRVINAAFPQDLDTTKRVLQDNAIRFVVKTNRTTDFGGRIDWEIFVHPQDHPRAISRLSDAGVGGTYLDFDGKATWRGKTVTC